MRSIIAALIAGLLFGAGLAVSRMVDPAKVIGFLDLAGGWDPTLAFVMGGALAVAIPGFALTRRRDRPLFGERFELPGRTSLDAPLIGGAVVFGIGWGLAGFCPGPALAALATGLAPVWIFVLSMVGGMLLVRLATGR